MKITPDVNNWGYFIERRDHFIKDGLLGIWNILILRLRSLKSYNPSEHPITSRKMTLIVFRSFFCKKSFERNTNHRYSTGVVLKPLSI